MFFLVKVSDCLYVYSHIYLSRLVIATVLINKIKAFLFYTSQHRNVILDVQEIYIYDFKQAHHMLIDFNMIPHLLEVCMEQM